MDEFDEILNEGKTFTENDLETEQIAREFLREAKQNETTKSTSEEESEKSNEEFIKGIELSEILKFLPPDTIQSLISPTTFILKQKYSKDFDKDTLKEIETILNDSESILAIKKRCLTILLEDYCKAKGISIESFSISPLWVYLALEFFSFKQKYDALEGLKNEMSILNGEKKL